MIKHAINNKMRLYKIETDKDKQCVDRVDILRATNIEYAGSGGAEVSLRVSTVPTLSVS